MPAQEFTPITKLTLGDCFELPITRGQKTTHIPFVVRRILYGENDRVIGVQGSPLITKDIKNAERFRSQSFALNDQATITELGIQKLKNPLINIGAVTVLDQEVDNGQVVKIGHISRQNRIGKLLIDTAPSVIIPLNRFRQLDLPQQPSLIIGSSLEGTAAPASEAPSSKPTSTDEITALYDITFNNLVALGLMDKGVAERLSDPAYILPREQQIQNGAITSNDKPIEAITSLRAFERAVTGPNGPEAGRLRAVWGLTAPDSPQRDTAFKQGMNAIQLLNDAVRNGTWNTGELRGRVTGPAPDDRM